MKNYKTGIIMLLAAFTATTPLLAQEKIEASVGADIVSNYIWRGQNLGGFSVQPSLGVSYKGVSLSAWGSVGLESKDTKEIDLTLGYSTGRFSISVTDFWTHEPNGETDKYFHYGARSTAHVFGAQVGYDFGPLEVNWYTNFAGRDGVDKDGDRAYSSFLSLTAPFKLGGLEWTAEVGATPWATDYYESNGFAVCDVSLGVSKEIGVTESFRIPIFAKATWNPGTENAYLVFGLTF